MQSVSPLIAWFFAFILIALAGRAAARLALARTGGALGPAERNRELGHAAMGFGMAVLLAPGIPRPPQSVSVCFFAVLAGLAAVECARRLWAGRRGRAVAAPCGPGEGGGLLDTHHAIVGLAMVVMLVQPAGSVVTGPAMPGTTGTAGMAGMAGMATGTSTPSTAVLLLLAYIWIAALVLGHGMTRVLATPQPDAGRVDGANRVDGGGTAVALLSSPATVYACEIAMTVLTGLMLLN